MIYLVTYDLNQSGQRYNDLIAAIKTYNCIHAMQSVWLIKTINSASQVFQDLAAYLDPNDSIFITEIPPNRAGRFPQAAINFLSQP